MNGREAMNKIMNFLKRPWLTLLTKTVYTLFKTIVSQIDGEVQNVDVKAIYNIHFIYHLDNVYEAAGVRSYDRTAPSDEKIAIFLFDSINNIAEPYLPVTRRMVDEATGQIIELGDEEMDDIPPMSFRDGGEPVTTRVDLDDPHQFNDGAGVNIRTG
jgi:hypothetical protein